MINKSHRLFLEIATDTRLLTGAFAAPQCPLPASSQLCFHGKKNDIVTYSMKAALRVCPTSHNITVPPIFAMRSHPSNR